MGPQDDQGDPSSYIMYPQQPIFPLSKHNLTSLQFLVSWLVLNKADMLLDSRDVCFAHHRIPCLKQFLAHGKVVAFASSSFFALYEKTLFPLKHLLHVVYLALTPSVLQKSCTCLSCSWNFSVKDLKGRLLPLELAKLQILDCWQPSYLPCGCCWCSTQILFTEGDGEDQHDPFSSHSP